MASSTCSFRLALSGVNTCVTFYCRRLVIACQRAFSEGWRNFSSSPRVLLKTCVRRHTGMYPSIIVESARRMSSEGGTGVGGNTLGISWWSEILLVVRFYKLHLYGMGSVFCERERDRESSVHPLSPSYFFPTPTSPTPSTAGSGWVIMQCYTILNCVNLGH